MLPGSQCCCPKPPAPPQAWGDTRPITLSSAILKWFAQLLLVRGGHQLQDGDIYQWARRGRQGTELLVILRRVRRMARDWGVPVWVVKLDIRKAFDSVWQESMGDLVARRVGLLLQGGGTALWGTTLGSQSLAGAAGGKRAPQSMEDILTSIPQSNGVGQGSPDSPVLFAAIIATALDEVLAPHCTFPRRERAQPASHRGGLHG